MELGVVTLEMMKKNTVINFNFSDIEVGVQNVRVTWSLWSRTSQESTTAVPDGSVLLSLGPRNFKKVHSLILVSVLGVETFVVGVKTAGKWSFHLTSRSKFIFQLFSCSLPFCSLA